jgi:hypothetical protein
LGLIASGHHRRDGGQKVSTFENISSSVFSFFIFSSSSAHSFFSRKKDSQLSGGEQFDLAELHKSSYTFREGSSIQVPSCPELGNIAFASETLEVRAF